MLPEQRVRSCATFRRRCPGAASIRWWNLSTKSTVAQARPLIRTLFFSVTVVLFIACANLAGLLLLRVIRRSREVSVRLALGASGASVLRQSLVEVFLLSLGGGLVGLDAGLDCTPRWCQLSSRNPAPREFYWSRLAGSGLCICTCARYCLSVRPHPGGGGRAHQRQRGAERRRPHRQFRNFLCAPAFRPGDRGTRRGAGPADLLWSPAAQL